VLGIGKLDIPIPLVSYSIKKEIYRYVTPTLKKETIKKTDT